MLHIFIIPCFCNEYKCGGGKIQTKVNKMFMSDHYCDDVMISGLQQEEEEDVVELEDVEEQLVELDSYSASRQWQQHVQLQ